MLTGCAWATTSLYSLGLVPGLPALHRDVQKLDCPLAIASGHPSEWRKKAKEQCTFIPKICVGWRETLSSAESNTTSASWCSVPLQGFPFKEQSNSFSSWRGHIPEGMIFPEGLGCCPVVQGHRIWILYPRELRSPTFPKTKQTLGFLQTHAVVLLLSEYANIFWMQAECLLMDLYSSPHQLPSSGPFPLPPSLFS